MSELTFNEEKFQEMMDRLCDAVPDDVSSIEELSLYYDIFKKGYQYAVDKAEKWIKENVLEFEHQSFVHEFDDCIKDFRKAMEE